MNHKTHAYLIVGLLGAGAALFFSGLVDGGHLVPAVAVNGLGLLFHPWTHFRKSFSRTGPRCGCRGGSSPSVM